MAVTSLYDPVEVTFICPGTHLEIRMSENTTRAICAAARTLRASHFVCPEGWSIVDNCASWGVFDMRGAQQDTPVRGEWSIDDPVKTFPTKEAAVMFAIILTGKR